MRIITPRTETWLRERSMSNNSRIEIVFTSNMNKLLWSRALDSWRSYELLEQQKVIVKQTILVPNDNSPSTFILGILRSYPSSDMVRIIEEDKSAYYRHSIVATLDIKEYGMRINHSNYTPLRPITRPYIVTGSERIERIVFITENYNLQFDKIIKSSCATECYQITMRLPNTSIDTIDDDTIDDVIPAIDELYTIYQSESASILDLTPTLPTVAEINEVTSLVAGLSPVKMRDITLEDLTYDKMCSTIKYSIGVKHDGDNMMLVVNRVGIWLINVPICKLIHRHSQFNDNQLLILDGEYIQRDENADYWIYDCYYVDGINVRNDSHLGRLNAYAQSNNVLLDVFRTNNVLALRLKEFKSIRGVHQSIFGFWKTTNLMLDMYKMLKDDTPVDGLVFIPDMRLPRPNESPYPYLKWKPYDKLTIDLQVNNTNGKLLLYTRSAKGVPMIYRSYDKPIPDNLLELMNPKYNGNIVELHSTDLKFNRIRFDKIYPNAIHVINNVINRSISEEVLRGNTLRLVRQHHLRLKRKLYDLNYSSQEQLSGPTIIAPTKGQILLDIGSGQLGTIHMWDRFQTVICVEPDLLNRESGFQRMSRDGIYYVPTGGEDHNTISIAVSLIAGRKVDVISLMMSLQLMYNSDRLPGLISTIRKCLKPGGIIIYIVPDGVRLMNAFRPTNPTITSTDAVSTNLFQFKLINKTQYSATIYDTIVRGEQLETLVNIVDFADRLKGTYTINTADGEALLNESELIYTNLYSYGEVVPGIPGLKLEARLSNIVGEYNSILSAYLPLTEELRDYLFKVKLIDLADNVLSWRRLTNIVGSGLILVSNNIPFFHTALQDSNSIIEVVNNNGQYQYNIVSIYDREAASALVRTTI